MLFIDKSWWVTVNDTQGLEVIGYYWIWLIAIVHDWRLLMRTDGWLNSFLMVANDWYYYWLRMIQCLLILMIVGSDCFWTDFNKDCFSMKTKWSKSLQSTYAQFFKNLLGIFWQLFLSFFLSKIVNIKC